MHDDIKTDDSNQFGVRWTGYGIMLHRPPIQGNSYTPEEALNLAAWLVAMSGKPFSEFEDIYNGVKGS